MGINRCAKYWGVNKVHYGLGKPNGELLRGIHYQVLAALFSVA